jgi:Leucine-rich repeat (LRR) protein
MLDLSNQHIEDWEDILNVIATNKPDLRSLDLHDNNLRYVPTELSEICPNLQELNLNGNAFDMD